jgi:hypothetical protein
MTEYTQRRIIVLRSDQAVKGNQAAKAVDTEGGEWTFEGASPALGTRWCNWAMKPSELAALESEFANRGLSHAVELVPDAAGQFHPKVNTPVLIFDASEWAPPEVQAVLANTDPDFAAGLPEGAIDGVVL